MSSRLHPRSGRLLLLALIASLALGACGKKGAPMPPPKLNPAPASDLVAVERGPRLILAFTYPKTTVSGLALPGIAAVQLWVKTGPAPTSGEPKPVDSREFSAEAKLLTTLKGNDLSAAIHGDQVLIDVPMEQLPKLATAQPAATAATKTTAPTSAATTTGGEAASAKSPAASATAPPSEPSNPPRPALWLAVRTISTRGDSSPFSNQATVIPAPPPPSPQALEAKPKATGIDLSWGGKSENIRGYRVYRRLSSERSYGKPLATLGADQKHYLDQGARFGQRYTYTVVAVSAASPFVESALGGETEVDYQDRFAPPVPQRLVALPTQKQVRLLWEASHAEDLLGYLVERRSVGSESWQRLTPKPEGATQYEDHSVEPGTSYEYRVLSVDESGNESAPSAPASATVPGS